MTGDDELGQLDLLRYNLLALAEHARSLEAKRLEATLQAPAAAPAVDRAPVARPQRTGTGRKRGRAAVIAWDMGHNPVGRAMVIYDLLEQDYDVELIGPIWSRYGDDLWGPIRNSHRAMRGFRCERFEDFYPAALAFAEAQTYDLVVACKARLPSMILGAMLKRQSACPMLVDVDDFELSFFKDETTAPLDDLIAGGPDALSEPYEQLASRAADGLVAACDGVLVSNVALRDRFGGYVIRHARDEDIFTPRRFNRDAERERLGLTPEDFALVFVGTARPHKGVFTVADTLEAMDDDRFVLHIVGDINNKGIENRLKRYDTARIVLHPGCDFDDLPSYIAAADAIPLLQEPDHPIAQFQIPAKISDAAALGVPVLATDVPPLRDLHHSGALRVIDRADLETVLREMITARDAQEGDTKTSPRIAFESEFGLDVNRERLLRAVDAAALASRDGALPDAFTTLLDHVHDIYVALRKARAKAAAQSRFKSGKDKPDVVAFWKQNDSGIYGRRSDMLLKHVRKSGLRNRVALFDAAMPIEDLTRLAEASAGPQSHHAAVLAHTVDNCLGLSDGKRMTNRTFVYGRSHNPKSYLCSGTDRSTYPDWVAGQLEDSGIVAAEAEAWCFPVVIDFPAISEAISFKTVLCDIVDDQRAFSMRAAWRRKIEENYETVLPAADLVTTNCQPNVEAFSPLAPDIHVIPNGTERLPRDITVPEPLASIDKPVAGYVGNLRDRIDWDLLAGAAEALPDVVFYIIGGGERPEDVAAIKSLPNVTFAGVVPYDQVQAYIAGFDVALMPHKQTVLTQRMNPLKIYNYFAAMKPIVSTEVANIDTDLQRFIHFAHTPEDFAEAIQMAIAKPPKVDAIYKSALERVTWSSRVESLVELIERKT